jgi:hypothetical protein
MQPVSGVEPGQTSSDDCNGYIRHSACLSAGQGLRNRQPDNIADFVRRGR